MAEQQLAAEQHRTLAAEGLLTKEEGTSRYRLGLRLVELARTADRDLEVRKVAHPLVERLRDELAAAR
jgi:DNA-binding IclR family transcriptional regulator